MQWLLQEFLPFLNDWQQEAMATPGLTAAERKKLCLSDQTLEGLRITGKSKIEAKFIILNYLWAELQTVHNTHIHTHTQKLMKKYFPNKLKQNCQIEFKPEITDRTSSLTGYILL